jgi:Ca2+-binding RTX toxin-like protein
LALDSDVFDVNTTTASDQRAPDITALSDGKFAIVWKSYDSDGTDGFTGYDITLRVFDGAGGAPAEFVAPEDDHYYDHEPKIATLPNGNFVVTWYNSSNNLTNGGSGDIHLAIYQDAPGYPRVMAQTIPTTDPVEQYAHHPDIAVDPVTGQFVLVWEQRNITVVGSDKTIMAQRFDAHGVAQGGAFVLHDVAGLDDGRAKVAFLTDGRLVAIWRTDIVADPNNTHAGTIFDTDGTRHDFAFSANDELFTTDPEIIATADGGFAIVWNGYQAVTYTTDILIERFDSDGNPVAQGDWPSTDPDERLTGTSGHDQIDGGTGNDTILGQRGDDTLTGFDGYDVILGGRGRDKIDGGAGDDFLRGHQGNDMIQGGEGHDKLFGNLGNDTLRGQEGDDTISGGQGHDHIEGGSGNDSLYGGNGNIACLGTRVMIL